MQVQATLLNSELVNSSHLLIVQNMLSTKRIEVLLSKSPLDNSSEPPLNSSSFYLSFPCLFIYISLLFYIVTTRGMQSSLKTTSPITTLRTGASRLTAKNAALIITPMSEYTVGSVLILTIAPGITLIVVKAAAKPKEDSMHSQNFPIPVPSSPIGNLFLATLEVHFGRKLPDLGHLDSRSSGCGWRYPTPGSPHSGGAPATGERS